MDVSNVEQVAVSCFVQGTRGPVTTRDPSFETPAADCIWLHRGYLCEGLNQTTIDSFYFNDEFYCNDTAEFDHIGLGDTLSASQ